MLEKALQDFRGRLGKVQTLLVNQTERFGNVIVDDRDGVGLQSPDLRCGTKRLDKGVLQLGKPFGLVAVDDKDKSEVCCGEVEFPEGFRNLVV